MKTDLFQSCSQCWVFQNWWHIECSPFTASSSRIWKSATGIPSPPLALFVVMLPKAHLTVFFFSPPWLYIPGCLALGWWSHHHDYLIHVGVWINKLWYMKTMEHSVQFSSVAQLCPTLCDLMNYSTPGLPVHHQLSEFTLTHVCRAGDAIQASHPLSSPFPPAPNPSQHQSLFQWVSSSYQVAKVLKFQLQHQSFKWVLFFFF